MSLVRVQSEEPNLKSLLLKQAFCFSAQGKCKTATLLPFLVCAPSPVGEGWGEVTRPHEITHESAPSPQPATLAHRYSPEVKAPRVPAGDTHSATAFPARSADAAQPDLSRSGSASARQIFRNPDGSPQSPPGFQYEYRGYRPDSSPAR